jgi:hypothetical protein
VSNPKKHHYVQRAYLHRWSDTSGDIYICDLSNGNIHKGPAKSAAWEKYYYCLEDPSHPEYRFEIEEFLGNDIENPAGPLIDKLDDEKELSSEEKAHLALYIAFQKTRVPFFEKFSNELAEKFDKEGLLKVLNNEPLFEKFMAEHAEKYKNLAQMPSREEMIMAIEENRIQMTYPRAHSLKNMLQISLPLSDLYAQRQWILLEAKVLSFITSDNPAVTISLARKDGGMLGETIFPLSPRHCILIDQENRGKFAVTEEDLVGVREINRRTLLHATRYLFGNSEEVLKECYKEYARLESLRSTMKPANLHGGQLLNPGEKLFTKRHFIL